MGKQERNMQIRRILCYANGEACMRLLSTLLAIALRPNCVARAEEREGKRAFAPAGRMKNIFFIASSRMSKTGPLTKLVGWLVFKKNNPNTTFPGHF